VPGRARTGEKDVFHHTPHPRTPHQGRRTDLSLSDEALSAVLREPSGRTSYQRATEELLARHWQPVFDYARVCTVSSHTAGILATAVFTQVFAASLRRAGPRAAWRPGLLAAVRDTAAQWAADPGRQAAVGPAFRPPQGRSGAAVPVPEHRRIAHRAFQRLPEPARCLLWHGDVEAEGPQVPATLLGVDPGTAVAQLETSRTQFREACVAAHRELAVHETCRCFTRLLDVSVHRGGTHLVPDLQHHLTGCAHCRHAAEQLDHTGDRRGVLIAEAVLVQGARAYLDSRPARRTAVRQSIRVMGRGEGSWSNRFEGR
jgi:DNA-directed RNA polymerase specialized sigma24 family protein